METTAIIILWSRINFFIQCWRTVSVECTELLMDCIQLCFVKVCVLFPLYVFQYV